MNTPELPDPLDALLRENQIHLKDEGFTARVIATLPVRPRKFPVRFFILIGAVAIGFALLFFLPLQPVYESALNAFSSFNLQSGSMLLTVFLVLASLYWSFSATIDWEN